jgi:glycosyltransferase domain-containing protein
MYSKDSINDFTIIILSLNRHNYLERILEFYENYDVNIKIVDSSINRFHSNILLKQNIEYIHIPNMEILDKVIYALEDIKTKYVVFCADDDFIFVDAIKSCCSFLENNHDYVCAQGRLITFKYSTKDNELEFIIENYFKIGEDKITSSNVVTRLLNFSNPYRHTFYGVHRTDN